MKAILGMGLIMLTGLFANTIYSKKFTTLAGAEVSMNLYQGKKILIVNIATGSNYAATQLPQLQQLSQLYKDNLVVIAFPSNDFGNEVRSNEEINSLLKFTYGVNFPVSVLCNIKGDLATVHPIYKWLQIKEENGVSATKVKGDFEKFLIDTNGEIIGIFSGDIAPMDKLVTDAVAQ
jgi:glutathione peroxidase